MLNVEEKGIANPKLKALSLIHPPENTLSPQPEPPTSYPQTCGPRRFGGHARCGLLHLLAGRPELLVLAGCRVWVLGSSLLGSRCSIYDPGFRDRFRMLDVRSSVWDLGFRIHG